MDERWGKAGDGYLMAYSIRDRDSLTQLEKWMDDLLAMRRDESLPIMVVGTKCDLTWERQVQPSGLYFSYYSRS
jgi:GTPase SAR1 family protein